MEEIGLVVEAHHHSSNCPGQNEIATRFNTLTTKADELKSTVRYTTLYAFGKTATFMP